MSPSRTIPRSALMGFALFIGLAGIFQGDFPLTHFDMREAIQPTETLSSVKSVSARLETQVDGVHRSLEKFERFGGLDPAGLLQPKEEESWGLNPMIMEAVRSELGMTGAMKRIHQALTDRALAPGEAPGPHAVAISLRVFHKTEEGSFNTFHIPLQQGTAWPSR